MNEARHRPSPDRRRSRARPASEAGRAPGAPPPCRGVRLWAKCAFGQRFLAHSPSRPGSARPRPGVPPLAPGAPLDAADRGPFTPLRCPGCRRGVASRDQPPESALRLLDLPPLDAACISRGWSRLAPARRDSAADQPVRHRWGSASRRLCLGTNPLVFRSSVTPSGDDGAGLVHVASVDPREPHRRPVRWGAPGRLTRFLGIESAPGDMAARTTWIVASNQRGPPLSPCPLSRRGPQKCGARHSGSPKRLIERGQSPLLNRSALPRPAARPP